LRKANKVKGLFPALITPFDAKGRVDPDATAGLAKFLISNRVDGLLLCGSTGLGPLLSIQERKQVAETVLGNTSAGVPVVVQVGAADTASSVELARHAEDHGAYALASLTPYYYKPGDQSIIKHFETIGRAVSVPLFAYNIPQFTGNNLRPAMVAELAKKRTLAGIKDSTRDVLQLLELLGLVPEGFVVMNGTEEYAMFAMMMGGQGLVSGGANAFPELFVSLVEAVQSRNYKDAIDFQRKVIQFKDAVSGGPIPSYYEILRRRGVDCGQPRPPFLSLNRDDKARLEAHVARLGMPAFKKS
jgi:4-hydroxy-tetrahydrodipicolinate synthase